MLFLATCIYHYRLQQEAMERETDEKIASSVRDKQLREQQIEQELRIAQVMIILHYPFNHYYFYCLI